MAAGGAAATAAATNVPVHCHVAGVATPIGWPACSDSAPGSRSRTEDAAVTTTRRADAGGAAALLRTSFLPLLRRAGLPRMRFHDLRHSAATILLAAGVPERVVMEILGHSTLAMVKRYQHVLPGLTVAAAERMDRVMGR